MLETILNTTLPVFILIGAGYCAVRFNFVAQDGAVAIGRYVLYFALPAMIYTTITKLEFTEVFSGHFFVAYAGGSLISLALAWALAHKVLKQDLSLSSIKTLGSGISNSVFFGYPVMLQIFGDAPAVAVATALISENLILFPVALTLIEYAIAKESGEASLLAIWKKVGMRVVKNPLVLAISASLVASATHFTLPEVVEKSFVMLAASSAPVALFSIGAALVGTQLKGSLVDLSSLVTCKLIIHPLLVLGMVFLLPDFDPTLQMAAVVLAAMPMMSVYPIIGGGYGYGKLCASALLATTLASFVTISAIVVLIN
ncbi:MAG: AEC family transporter [Pontibacterium sp.]